MTLTGVLFILSGPIYAAIEIPPVDYQDRVSNCAQLFRKPEPWRRNSDRLKYANEEFPWYRTVTSGEDWQRLQLEIGFADFKNLVFSWRGETVYTMRPQYLGYDGEFLNMDLEIHGRSDPRRPHIQQFYALISVVHTNGLSFGLLETAGPMDQSNSWRKYQLFTPKEKAFTDILTKERLTFDFAAARNRLLYTYEILSIGDKETELLNGAQVEYYPVYVLLKPNSVLDNKTGKPARHHQLKLSPRQMQVLLDKAPAKEWRDFTFQSPYGLGQPGEDEPDFKQRMVAFHLERKVKYGNEFVPLRARQVLDKVVDDLSQFNIPKFAPEVAYDYEVGLREIESYSLFHQMRRRLWQFSNGKFNLEDRRDWDIRESMPLTLTHPHGKMVLRFKPTEIEILSREGNQLSFFPEWHQGDED